MTECLTLKKSNCKNCYKCIRHCPVKAIRFSGNQAHIINNECILCGQCFVVCPQNAKQIVDDTEKAKVLLELGVPVVASIAPSFVANYGVGINAMRKALKKLGFYDVEETALGAKAVKQEYERLINEENRDILISSCCHSVNLLIQKYFPNLLPYLADVASPMQAHCIDITRRIPDAKTVFIGPCLSKKDEAGYYEGIVDCVLTFEELTNWLNSENIKIENIPDDDEDKGLTRLFPTTGGILKSMTNRRPDYTYMAIDGAENCITALKDIESGKISKCFIEMSACVGSCSGGPIMEKFGKSPVADYMAVARYAGNEDFKTDVNTENLSKRFTKIEKKLRTPSELEITDILRRMGKNTASDELNCGSCGYNTCREKAIAICQGKAEISMCLPYLKEKAESFSDSIVNNTPNGIIVLNSSLEVQQINAAARKIMNIRRASDVLGESVVRIIDPIDFVSVLNSGRDIRNKRIYLAEYEKYVEETIVPDKAGHLLVCILRDVTAEENERTRKEEISRKTLKTADEVVDKQMRIVQEIASLLGETAAETKIALTKLKESISDE